MGVKGWQMKKKSSADDREQASESFWELAVIADSVYDRAEEMKFQYCVFSQAQV